MTVADVDPSTLVGLGATEIRNHHFRDDQIPGIIVSYMHGSKVTLEIAAAAAATSLLISLITSYTRLRYARKSKAEKPGADEGAV